MKSTNVEESLKKISEELDTLEERRTRILNESRDILSLARRTIVDIHLSKINDAEKKILQIDKILKELRKVAGNDLGKYMIPSETEYVEAKVLHSIIRKQPLPSHKELSVNNISYLLGLGDVVGEVKRLVYDRIRIGKGSEALDLFDLMERIYILLSPLATYDNIAQGIRRKLDVCRILIEDTRSAVTEEIRRVELMETTNRLYKKIGLLNKEK